MSRDWTPIDNYNAEFIEYMHERENDPRPMTDYCRRHKQVVKEQSARNGLVRSSTMPLRIRAPGEEGHNYSTQTLNSTEQALEIIRQKIKEVTVNCLIVWLNLVLYQCIIALELPKYHCSSLPKYHCSRVYQNIIALEFAKISLLQSLPKYHCSRICQNIIAPEFTKISLL